MNTQLEKTPRKLGWSRGGGWGVGEPPLPEKIRLNKPAYTDILVYLFNLYLTQTTYVFQYFSFFICFRLTYFNGMALHITRFRDHVSVFGIPGWLNFRELLSTLWRPMRCTKKCLVFIARKRRVDCDASVSHICMESVSTAGKVCTNAKKTPNILEATASL